MFNRLKRLYEQERLTKEAILFYVEHGIITQEEYIEIVGAQAVKTKTK